MSALQSDAVQPRITAGLRLQWEPAQDCHVLLYPEGMVKLNQSAGEILKRCDALYRKAGKSNGADGEVRLADQLKLQVFYDLRDVPRWAEQWINRASYAQA